MADVQIKDLNEVQSLASGDKLLVNTDNTTTNIIDFAVLLAALGNGGGGGEDGPGIGGFGFAPQFHNFPDSMNFTSYSVSAWESKDSLHGASATLGPFKMPKNADMALISFQYTASMHALPSVADQGSVWCQFSGSLNPTGGNVSVAAGCGADTTSICQRANMAMWSPATRNGTRPGDNYITSQQPIKFSILTFDKGAELTFRADGSLIRAKKCVVRKSAGRFILYPFNSAAIDIARLNEMINMANGEDIDTPPAPQPGEKEQVETDILVDYMKYLVDVCNKTLTDPNFTNVDDRNTVTFIRDEVFKLRGVSGQFDTINGQLNSFYDALVQVPGIGVSFPDFTPSGYQGYM